MISGDMSIPILCWVSYARSKVRCCAQDLGSVCRVMKARPWGPGASCRYHNMHVPYMILMYIVCTKAFKHFVSVTDDANCLWLVWNSLVPPSMNAPVMVELEGETDPLEVCDYGLICNWILVSIELSSSVDYFSRCWSIQAPWTPQHSRTVG